MSQPPEGTRLILASENLLDSWGTRDRDGYAITVEWGEPDENGWYAPTFTVHYDQPLIPTDVRDLLWDWAERTHGNEFGHDHHCPVKWDYSKGPWVGEEDPSTCTCGWSAYRLAYTAWSEANKP